MASREGARRVVLKDVEIVRKETKQRYIEILEKHIEQIEDMKTNVYQLSGIRKDMAIHEIIEAEKVLDMEIKRIADMVTVETEGEEFADR